MNDGLDSMGTQMTNASISNQSQSEQPKTWVKHKHYASMRERLLALTDRRGADECWPWIGAQFKGSQKRVEARGWKASAYGTVRLPHGSVYAHRATYTEFVGPIPVGYTIDHKCFDGLCQNPAHLEAVTQAENSRRYMALKHWPNREVKPRPEPAYYGDIRRFAASSGLSGRAIAAALGVSATTVFNALHSSRASA